MIGLVFGADYAAGPLGILALLALSSWTAFSFALIGAWLALRTGTSETLQGVFPILFAALFLSTLNMPRELIAAGWFKTVTALNPVSYMVDGMRSLIITGWDKPALMVDIALLAVISVIAIAGCSRALRRRMAE